MTHAYSHYTGKRFRWDELPKPFFVLAPMEGVTDTVFRKIVAHAGRPDVMFTEFTNVTGLLSRGRRLVEQHLEYSEVERPLIAQVWGIEPKDFLEAANEIVERGFDGIDINMGCPDKNVLKKGGGGALCLNKPLASKIIKATQKAVAGRIPISVKIRIGFKETETETWAEFILRHGIDALTIHGRTVQELSLVPARWEEIAKVVKLRNRMKIKTQIIGNGDVWSLADGKKKVESTGVDGVMVGRGIFRNIWFFNQGVNPETVLVQERLQMLLRHIEEFEAFWGERRPYQLLKKYFKIYVSDFNNASELRAQLMETNSGQEASIIVRDFLINQAER